MLKLKRIQLNPFMLDNYEFYLLQSNRHTHTHTHGSQTNLWKKNAKTIEIIAQKDIEVASRRILEQVKYEALYLQDKIDWNDFVIIAKKVLTF